ncbi:protein ELYS isoform X2 [Synchiropus splendidus]|uniref:protein ELYS isoform X2 n=1 Tax=Synchiropus splendidus TaxID=270530 RepID=UPI00237E8024|nr:protein ELYS isoform X2 [Synchiropus splendidus]
MQDLTAKVTSRLLSFPAVTQEALGEDEISLASELHGHFTVGRTGLAWLATGPQLEVVHAMTGERLSAYRFSSASNQPPTVLVARDFSWLKRSGLLVGLEEENCSVLCLYDLGLSRVVKAVAIPGRITAIEPLVSYGGASTSTQHLHQGLRWFFGIAAVVTDLGHILLVDLCLDDLSCSQSELKAADLWVAILGDEIPKVRELSRRTGQHTCLQLKKPSGVGVTALQFVSRTNQLCVGFSDGSLQLWNVKTLKREYHSTLDGGQVPVHAFTFQEPENDPRSCCYLWVVQSSQDLKGDMVSLHLLQLAFSERKCLSSGKILYEGLEYCEERFSQDLGGQGFPLGTLTTDTRLLSCQTIEKFRPHPDRDDSVNDVASPDTSVSIFVWQVKVYGQGAPTAYIGLFDINRWYHAQMPDSLRTGQSLQNCPYFAVWTLEPVVQMVSPHEVLDVLVHDRSLSRGLPLTCPPPEQYFNPTTYNFDASCLLDSGIVHLTCSGYQKETLSFLKKAAPCTSDNISSIYSLCLMSGLLSSRLSDSHNSSLSQEEQLDAILSTAVETSSLGLITGCIQQWTAEEEPGSALNLRYILDWAWNKVVQTKEELDTICSPLFNCSSNFIDSLTLQLLQHSQRLLGNLSSIFHCLLTEAQELTQNGLLGLINKNMVSSLISKYAQVVLWFCRVGLLPEGPDDDGLQLARPIYSHSAISVNYTAYRDELRWLTKGGGPSDCLMIDGLVSQGGEALRDLWKRDVGGTGLYPPPSLHALLDIYLLANVEEEVKHAIVIYLLLDVMYSSPNKEEASVESFPSAFAIPTGLMKLAQGFWLLDHHDNQRAFQVLLHPAVSKCQFEWQHERVLRVLMCRRQRSLALRYLQAAKPSVSTCAQAKLYLSVLLHNRCMIEAWSLLRQHRSHLNMDELLGVFFESCQELGLIKELLKLPLDVNEQEYLEKFLKTTRGVVNRELLMVHYLQQANYIPALQLNQTLKTQLLTDRDPKQKERSITRNSIMHLYGKVLPRAQRKLAMERAKPYHHPHTSHKEVTRPQPLSTITKRSTSQNVMSRAGFINNVLNKIEEVWLGKAGSPVSSPARSPSVGAEVCSPATCPAAQPEPFLGTPIPLSSKGKSRLLGLVFHPSRQSPVPPSCPLSPLGSKASSKSASKAPEFSLLQTPQVVKRARALAAAGPVFSGFTPQSILRSSLRPTPVATPSASPGRSVTPPPPRRRDNRITFIEDSPTPEAEKVMPWSNGEAADREIHLLTRDSLKASCKTWSPQAAEGEDEDEGQPRVKFHEAADGAKRSLLVPARINLSLDSSFQSAQSANSTLECYEVMPSGDQEDRGQRAPPEEEDDDVVVVTSKTRLEEQQEFSGGEVPQLTPGEAEREMKEMDSLVEEDPQPKEDTEVDEPADGTSPSEAEEDIPGVENTEGAIRDSEEGLLQTTGQSGSVQQQQQQQQQLVAGEAAPPPTSHRHDVAEAEQREEEHEDEDDSGSEVEIIEEVQGNGRLRTLQSAPMFGAQDQEIFIPTLSEEEDAEFSLVTPGAQIKVVGEEMGGEVLMVRLGAEVEAVEEDPGPESSYMEVKPSTTLLVPLELVDGQPDFDRLPDVHPAEDHRCLIENSFSLMLDMDEDPAKETENQLQFPEMTEVELQIQPETLSQMEEVVKPTEVMMGSSEDLDPIEEQTGANRVSLTLEEQQTPAQVEPFGVEHLSATEMDSSSDELKTLEERLSTEEEPSPEKEEPSPEKEEPSPEREEPSPEREEPSPEREEPSPEREEPSPEREEPSPEREEPSPEREEPSPEREEPLPEREEPLPEREEPLPEREEPLPEREEPLPEREEPLPEKEEPSPEKEEPLTEREGKEEPLEPEELKDTLPFRPSNVKNERSCEMVQPIQVEETFQATEPDGYLEEQPDSAFAATGKEKETRTVAETRPRTRATRKAEEAPEEMQEEQPMPDTLTSLRKKEAPSTPSRRTTRAKHVTFISPVSEEGGGPDTKATGTEAPPSPGRTPRKTRKNTDTKVLASPTRRSARRAAAATEELHLMESVASTQSPSRSLSSQSSWEAPAQQEAPQRTPTRRSTRKLSDSSDAAPELLKLKSRSKVWEPALLEEDEGPEPELGPSPSRRARPTSHRSERSTRAGATSGDLPEADRGSQRPLRTKVPEQSKEDLQLLDPLEVDSDTGVADALLKRIQDKEKQEGDALFRKAVRTRSSRSTSEDVKEIQIPEPEEDESSPGERSHTFSPSRKRTRATRSKSPGPVKAASARVTRSRSSAVKEAQDDVTSEEDHVDLPKSRRTGMRTAKCAALPHLSSIAEAVLISPLPSPGPQSGSGDGESPTQGVSRRHKRVMDAVVRRPATRRRKL